MVSLRSGAWLVLILAYAGALRGQSGDRISRVAAHYAAQDGFSGTVTYARAGKVIFQGAYGLADRERHIAFDTHTRLHIGSVSKQFTAAAILLLQQDGKLHTSDPLGTLLPDATPAGWQAITVRQMLSHTSGLPDYAGRGGDAFRAERHRPADMLTLVRDLPLESKPGERFGYSNTNYLLLSMIVEKTSGMSFCAFLDRRLFGPQGLHDTGCAGEPEAAPVAGRQLAIGYVPTEEADGKAPTVMRPVLSYGATFFQGAAGLLSTGSDLARWSDALHHGRVLNPASYQEMVTPVLNGFAYGIRNGNLRNHLRLDHDGSIPGFRSEFEYLPGSDTVIAVLSNLHDLEHGQYSPGVYAIDSELMTLAVEPETPLPSEGGEVVPPVAALELLTGRYVADDGKQAAFAVKLAGTHLEAIQEGGHGPTQLRGSYGELDFYLSDTEALIEFSGEGAAVIFDLRHSQAVLFHRVSP